MNIVYQLEVYPLSIQKIEIPTDAQIFSVKNLKDELVMGRRKDTVQVWVLLDQLKDTKPLKVGRFIEFIPNNVEMSADARNYIDTVEIDGVVLHVFERL